MNNEIEGLADWVEIALAAGGQFEKQGIASMDLPDTTVRCQTAPERASNLLAETYRVVVTALGPQRAKTVKVILAVALYESTAPDVHPPSYPGTERWEMEMPVEVYLAPRMEPFWRVEEYRISLDETVLVPFGITEVVYRSRRQGSALMDGDVFTCCFYLEHYMR